MRASQRLEQVGPVPARERSAGSLHEDTLIEFAVTHELLARERVEVGGQLGEQRLVGLGELRPRLLHVLANKVGLGRVQLALPVQIVKPLE